MQNLKGKFPEELALEFKEMGLPAYRGKQAFMRIYRHRATSIDEFTEFPKELREALAPAFRSLSMVERSHAPGGTEKFIFEYSPEGEKSSRFRSFESVWIVSKERRTACISSQSGCTLNCAFCATGTLPFSGNLEAWMIVDQVYELMHARPGERLTNVVFMGMGEPFHNYDNALRAAHILNHPHGLALGARHITLSTAGVVPMIHRFIEEKQPFNLAISLNHPDPEQRSQIMDIDLKYPLEELLDAARRLNRELHRPVMFEYVMIPEKNMDASSLKRLIQIARRVHCKINLIPLNTNLQGWRRPTDEEVAEFQQGLRSAGILAFNRGSPGREVNGACGMLAFQRLNAGKS
jgi:23S rRNA (adenine2503-C2)-methyltransferase